MDRQPIPLRECVSQWQAYKAGVEGTPLPDAIAPPSQEDFEAFGRTVLQEMQDDPVFFRLVIGKLGGKLFGLL